MSTKTATLESLVFIQGRLNKLHEENYVRYEGNTVFQEARQELATVIDRYEEPEAPAPVIVQKIMDAGQVEALLVGITAEIHASDIVVLDAITASKDEVLAGLPK